MNRGENVNTSILMRICAVLDCDISEIVEIVRHKKEYGKTIILPEELIMGKKKELTYLEAMSEIISGIGIYESVSGYPDIRRASHISEWAEGEANRLNPENGLCLSATYDAAFDRHLISFDKRYRLIVSKTIKGHYTDAAAKSCFINLEGQKMPLPAKLLSLSYFRTGGTPSTAHPEYWNGSIQWVSAKDFKTFRFEDSEDHVAELAPAEINAVHEWICADDEKKLKSYSQQFADDGEKGFAMHCSTSGARFRTDGVATCYADVKAQFAAIASESKKGKVAK